MYINLLDKGPVCLVYLLAYLQCLLVSTLRKADTGL